MKKIVLVLLLCGLMLSTCSAGFTQTPNAVSDSLSLTRDSVSASAVDWWPMFHHDLNHTGTSTSTAPTTNNTLWKYTTGAPVYSSPAVVGGLVYVGSDDKNVYCLNAATGALVWNYTTNTTNGFVESSPVVVGDLVYVGSHDANVYCLNATTGTKVWNYTTGNWPVGSSPAVVGDLVYVGSWDHKVYCLNAATGAFVWSYKTGLYVESSPAVVSGVVYVGSTDGKVYAFGPPTSTQLEFSLLPNLAYVGQTVILLGNLSDDVGQPVGNAEIDLFVNGTFSGKLFTNSSGWFTASGKVTSPGTFNANATYVGNVTYNPSSHTETLTVYQMMPTIVTFRPHPSPAKVGQTVTLTGNLTDIGNSPIVNAPLELWVKVGTGPWSYKAALYTNSTGWFQASGKVTSAGTYQLAVVYRGTSKYKMSYYMETLTVNP